MLNYDPAVAAILNSQCVISNGSVVSQNNELFLLELFPLDHLDLTVV